MKKLALLLIVLFTINISTAQTSKTEIKQIIKEQSDGIVSNSQKGVATVYNDSKSVVTTVYGDLKSSAPKVYKALESLAKELKTTTDALWIILVKQQLVWSICFLILTLTSIINWFLFYKRNLNIKLKEENFIIGKEDVYVDIENPKFEKDYFERYERCKGNSSYRSELADIRFQKVIRSCEGQRDILLPIINPTNNWFKYLHLIICLVLSLLSIYHFSDMLTGIMNPEFGALKTITMVVQSFK
jgi:hypothetical protein